MSVRPTELAFITIGSNIRPEIHLPDSIDHLRTIGANLAVSNAYLSKPVGGRDQPDFMNAAVMIRVAEEPARVRRQLRQIEGAMGRVRTEDKFASRPIDLDLVLYGNLVDEELGIPDPEILTREHLAVPLGELAPDFCHPVTMEALGSIAARLKSGELQYEARLSQRLSDLAVQRN